MKLIRIDHVKSGIGGKYFTKGEVLLVEICDIGLATFVTKNIDIGNDEWENGVAIQWSVIDSVNSSNKLFSLILK